MKNSIKIAALLSLAFTLAYPVDPAAEAQVQFDDLQAEKDFKERELLQLRKRIREASRDSFDYTDSAIQLWNPPADIDGRSSFKKFIKKLAKAYDRGDDTQTLLENSHLDKELTQEEASFTMHALITQKLYIARLITEHQEAVEELREINQKLHSLKINYSDIQITYKKGHPW